MASRPNSLCGSASTCCALLHSLSLTFAYLIVFMIPSGSVECWSTAKCKRRRRTGSKYPCIALRLGGLQTTISYYFQQRMGCPRSSSSERDASQLHANIPQLRTQLAKFIRRKLRAWPVRRIAPDSALAALYDHARAHRAFNVFHTPHCADASCDGGSNMPKRTQARLPLSTMSSTTSRATLPSGSRTAT